MSPQRVLIVDSDSDAIESIGAMLTGAGYVVVSAATFDEAVAGLWLAKPDVLIASVRLGAYNGLHLVLRARRDVPGIVAIITDSALDPVLKTEAEAMHASYLVKPLTLDVLTKILRKATISKSRWTA